MPICKTCRVHFQNRIEIDGIIRNISNRKYCITCSPFGKHNTRRLHVISPVEMGTKICPRCSIEKDFSNFYKRRNGNDFSSYCKLCTTEETLERMRIFKQRCVDYKGGKCNICGYDKCNSALEFHHRDPSTKEFNISHVGITMFSETIKHELDKCDIFCSNCHREKHAE